MTGRVGRYELLFRIASGGMAEVYAARIRGEGGFEKIVAVKRMLPNLADNPEFMTMFLDEGRLAAHISSPNVVSTMDLGRSEDGSPYIVMELVLGVTLGQLNRAAKRQGRQLPVDVAVELLAQAAQGLHDAHEARTPSGQPLEIVHRDVSPQNILVGVDGRARITDFGVARALMRATQTTTGHVKGKFGYFSPEQVAGKPIDRRSDIFALGVVAWETLTGETLFRTENPLDSLSRVLSMDIRRLDELDCGVSKEVADVVAAALERDPDQRLATAGDLAYQLREAARASVGTVDAGTISRYVQETGGANLARLHDNIRVATDPSVSFDAPQDVPASSNSEVAPERPETVTIASSTRARRPSRSAEISIESELASLRPSRGGKKFVFAGGAALFAAALMVIVLTYISPGKGTVSTEPVSARPEGTSPELARTEALPSAGQEPVTGRSEDDGPEPSVEPPVPEPTEVSEREARPRRQRRHARPPSTRSGRSTDVATTTTGDRTQETTNSGNTNSGNTNSGNTNSGNTNSGNTNSGSNTNSGNTNSGSNTNSGNTNSGNTTGERRVPTGLVGVDGFDEFMQKK